MSDDVSTIVNKLAARQLSQVNISDFHSARCRPVKSSQNVEQSCLSAPARTYDRDHVPRLNLEVETPQSLNLDLAQLVGLHKRIDDDRYSGHENLTVRLILDRFFLAKAKAGMNTPRSIKATMERMLLRAQNGKITLRGASSVL